MLTSIFLARAASRLAAYAMAAIFLAGAALARPAVAADFDAAKHFKGKSIRLVVDFKPGGGTDVQARYFAANWGKFIPGNPKMAVTNLFPNPSGRNFTWKSAPDGLTLSFVASPGVGDEMVEPTAEFQSGKFTQIGSHAQRDVVFIVRGTVPYKSLADAKGGKIPLVLAEPVAAPDDLSGKLMAISLLAMWLDAPLKIAPVARSGTADALLMLERGDINSWMADSQWFALTKLRQGWFKSGFVRAIAEMGHPDAVLPANGETEIQVPNAYTWLTDEQKEVWKGIFLPEVIHGKAIIGPPNMPPEIAKVLRDAYAAAVTDPAFGEGLEKIQGQPAFLMRGEKLQELVAEATASFKEQLPRYNELRQQVYGWLKR